jgi:AraC-like DNA-binding protein
MTVLAFLSVLGAAQAVLLGTALFFAKSNRTANRLLGALAWVVAIYVSAAVMASSGIYLRHPQFSYVPDPLFFCVSPLFYLYVRAILFPGPLRVSDAVHLAPAIAVAICLLPWYMKPAWEKGLFMLQLQQGAFPAWFYIKSIALLVQGSVYVAIIAWTLYRHGQTMARPLREASAYISRNARFVIGVMAVFLIAGAFRVLRFFGYFDQFNLQENLILPLMAAVLMYLVSYTALRHPEKIYGPPDPAKKYERSGLSPQAAEAGLARLTAHMSAEKPYIDEGLTLQDLASKVDLAPNHLSQVINENWKMGFHEFLNSYRVKAAETMLLDPARGDTSILEIANEAGFNSKSAFNAAFRRHRGMTPTEFRSQSAKAVPEPS